MKYFNGLKKKFNNSAVPFVSVQVSKKINNSLLTLSNRTEPLLIATMYPKQLTYSIFLLHWVVLSILNIWRDCWQLIYIGPSINVRQMGLCMWIKVLSKENTNNITMSEVMLDANEGHGRKLR